MDPQRPARRTVVRASAWTVPVVAVAVTAPAMAASVPTARLVFDNANVYGADYKGATPNRLESIAQVQNQWAAQAPTLTTLVLTVTYPKTVVSGGKATNVTGAGWSYTKVVASGASWSYQFDWIGSAAPGGNTGTVGFHVPLANPYPSRAKVSATFTATASGSTTMTSASYELPA